jgi:formylglycine-generating enzyme required for sulfatase activity
MSGNVSEWTNSCIVQSGKTYCSVQGGNSQTLANGTVCGFDFVLQQQTFANFDLGFRCCSDHAP